jgi:hypothetical protein
MYTKLNQADDEENATQLGQKKQTINELPCGKRKRQGIKEKNARDAVRVRSACSL